MPAFPRPTRTRDRFVQQFGTRPVPYAEALAAGFSRASLQAAVDRDLLRRPRRGLLVAAPSDGRRTTAPAHVEEVRSVLATVHLGAMASDESAAHVHGVATPSPRPPRTVRLITTDRANFTSPGVILRTAPVPPVDRVVVDGLPATSIARTSIDVARGHRLPEALIPLDSAARLLIARATSTNGNALRHAVRDPELRAHASAELEEALSHCFGWAGTVAVRTALQHVDPASESPFESRSRGWFIDAGLGPLDPGRPIRCGSTTYWADFCSPPHRVIGEADGWSKYGDTASDIRRALTGERVRQHDLEEDGWRVVRWSTTDRRASVVRRMSSALSHT